MKRVIRKVILVLLILCIAAAGAFAGGKQGGDKAGDQIVIGVAMQDVIGMTRYMVTGMREYLKANSPNVKITVVTAENDASKQQEQVQMFVTQGVNAIVLNPVDMKMSVAAVDIAAKANIPVITLNTVSENKSVKAHVGSDDREAGRLQMERLIQACKEKGLANPRMAYVNAALGHSAQVLREEAYKEVLGKHPEVKLVVEERPTGMRIRLRYWLKTGSRNFPTVLTLSPPSRTTCSRVSLPPSRTGFWRGKYSLAVWTVIPRSWDISSRALSMIQYGTILSVRANGPCGLPLTRPRENLSRII